MTAFATTNDVEAAWRYLTADETTTAVFQLEFASEILRAEFVTIDDRIAAGSLSAVLVKGVVVAMILRAMKNPSGYRSVQESIEDYSTTKTRDSALSTGDVYLSESERKVLSRRASGAFSVTPAQEPTTCATLEQVALRRAEREAGWWDQCPSPR